MPKSGTPEKSSVPQAEAAPAAPGRARRAWTTRLPGRLVLAAAAVVAVVLLFVAYLQISRTYPENSDEANILLMSWDMLHGNLLLHGWILSDVSFYTTELPQYAILESFLGLHLGTAHIAAAMTYTLVLVLAVLLARSRAPRGEGWARMLLTAGIMFAPQLGVAVFVLLLSVGHIGTAVPLMLTWLVLDHSDRFRPRWLGPVAIGLLLTWALIADPLVLVIGIIPLVVVCAVRVIRAAVASGQPSIRQPWASLRANAIDVGLAVAAILAEALASLINRLLRASGGFILHPVGYQLAPVRTWPKHAYVTAKGLLALFGAKPQGPAPALAFAVVHLAGVALVAWAMWRVARHFLGHQDMVSQVLLVAMVVNVAVYVPSTLADATDLNAREFAIVLPFGAVLAGRTLTAGLREREGRRLVPALLAVLAIYAASLGYAAAQPASPPANQELAEFLAAHHLTDGIGGYWESSVVTVGSDGKVTVRAVLPGTLTPDLWMSKPSWFDPSSYHPTFLVTDSKSGFFNHWEPNASALARYGKPVRVYRTGPYTVYVYNRNLLARTGSS